MSSELAYALKYRPKKLSDIIGQLVPVQALTNAFKSDDLHHAFIFGGSKGSGKTTTARIIAAMENCETSSFDPCGKCNNCQAIFAGKSLDVKEIDAASTRGIDDIRNLRKECQYHPINCRTKYFILDECHALTGHAAEAALKIIEEPPSHVRFILCTTAQHRIKDTIHSRCIAFKFNKLSWKELNEHLIKVAKLENLDYDAESLQLAAKSANGSVRDALQNLQSLVAYAGDRTIVAEDAEKILGFPNERLYFEFIEAISKINVHKGIETIVELLKSGTDAKVVIDGLEAHLRNIMVILTCSKHLESFGFLEEQIKRYKYQISSLSKIKEKVEFVLGLLRLLYDINRGLVLNLDPQTLLERYLVEAIILKKKSEIAN